MSQRLDDLLHACGDAQRLADIAANDAAMQRIFRVEGDWYGGGFGYTMPFPTEAEALAWGQHKARFHPDAVVTARERPPLGQRGSATIYTLVGASVFAIALSVLGPALDGEPYGTPRDRTEDFRTAAAALVSHAEEQCRQAGGTQAGWTLSTSRGEIACVDQNGRKHRHVITILHRSQP